MEFTRKDGKKVKLWNTFFSEQVDIDPYKKPTQDYFDGIWDCWPNTFL